jgi:hypothetical protein
MFMWNAAGRTPLNLDEYHLALSSVKHLLDRGCPVFARPQGLHVGLKATQHRTATPISRGSGPTRVLHILDVRVPVKLRRLLEW